MPTEAGQGEHHAYRIPGTSPDRTPLTPKQHYLGVDAVAWFINKQGSWFSDRMASGTLDIKIAAGVEHYQAALGTFELKGESRTAPVFDRPVLPDRNYMGGMITFNVSMSAIKHDRVIAGLLKSAATASLGVVAGMVQTATAAGPMQLLGAAGDEILKGVRQVLSDTGEKREPLFDFSGFEESVSPTQVVGPETYLLMHRGVRLNPGSLSVQDEGMAVLPYVNGMMLDDGAWLLLRLRRSSTYPGQREWFDDARALRSRIRSLVEDFEAGAMETDDALRRLKPSATGTETVYDEFSRLRSVIQNDGVLSESEAVLYTGQLRTSINEARKSIQAGKPSEFHISLDLLKHSLLSGTGLSENLMANYLLEAHSLSQYRTAKAPDLALYAVAAPEAASVERLAPPREPQLLLANAVNMQQAVEESFV